MRAPLLFPFAFKTAIRQSELPRCCVGSSLTPPFSSRVSRRAPPSPSRSLTPRDLPRSARLHAPSRTPSFSSNVLLGRRHFHDHSSLWPRHRSFRQRRRSVVDNFATTLLIPATSLRPSTLSLRHLRLASRAHPTVHSAWVWILISRLSSNIPSNSVKPELASSFQSNSNDAIGGSCCLLQAVCGCV